MTDFTVVYIQLTALQAGAKYQRMGLIVMSESLEDLKAIIDNAPNGADEFFMHQGSVNYICNHDNGHEFEIWCKGEGKWVSAELIDDWQYIRGRRSLSDIKRFVKLMDDLDSISEAFK